MTRPSSPGPRRRRQRLAALALLPGLVWPTLSAGQGAAPPGDTSPALPADVSAALQRAGVPERALSVVLQEAGGARTLMSQQADVPVNPASLAKLLTTFAALELLGPAWTWATPVWLTGPVQDGVLNGDLVIRGSGDPKLVLERIWLLLRRVQAVGVRTIGGDIVLDSSAFAPPEVTPADFDGERHRAYNVLPDALMLNYKSVNYSFLPDPALGVAQVLSEPRLPEAPEATVPLAAGPCTDWRGALKASFDSARVRFAGSYLQSCGEQTWVTADAQPQTYNARLLQSMWRESGGRLNGRVREGRAPTDRPPSFELRSPPLAEVVRDINKFSNNVMAQQLFLTLAAQQDPTRPATAAAARALLARWATERLGDAAQSLLVDNGSGLSRDNRVSASALARLLQLAWGSAVMPELMSSLPVNGLDGTLRRSRATPGRAHLKTGSLRDVAGVAGYVLTDGGQRRVLVAVIQHPNANAARPALDALVNWAMRDLRDVRDVRDVRDTRPR